MNQTLEIREILRKITPDDKNPEWVATSFSLKKVNRKLRKVVDFRGLNRQLIWNAHPFFGMVDCTEEYWPLQVHPDDTQYLRFLTPFGSYEYLRAPMGLIH